MESTRRRIVTIFSVVFLLLGFSGINISGAVPTKYGPPAAPTDVEAVGGVEKATLTWMAPYSNGGKKITAYKVTYYPGAKIHMCNSSALRCVVDIPNPNKPSSKPPSVWYYFTVAAVNSVGTGPVSIVGHARVLIKFRATMYIAPKYGADVPTPTPTDTRTPTPTPTPSINAIPAPSRTPSTPPSPPANAVTTTTFDGTYTGQATVTVSTGTSGIGNTSTIATTFTVLNGRGQGSADNWNVNGYVTDLAGIASVTASNSLYGTFPFTVTFTQDPVTKVMSGNGRGVRTFTLSVYGEITVEFVFSVSRIS